MEAPKFNLGAAREFSGLNLQCYLQRASDLRPVKSMGPPCQRHCSCLPLSLALGHLLRRTICCCRRHQSNETTWTGLGGAPANAARRVRLRRPSVVAASAKASAPRPSSPSHLRFPGASRQPRVESKHRWLPVFASSVRRSLSPLVCLFGIPTSPCHPYRFALRFEKED
jgi:hypothetical protein